MREKIYTGSSKTLYHTDEEYALLMSFEDKLKLKNKESISVSGKGVINNSISAYIMQKLDMIGIDNHFIQKNNMRQQLVQFVDVFPVQVYVSTICSGRYVSDFGMEDGFVFDSPVIDYRVKNSELNYPTINESQMISFNWLSQEEISILKNKAIRVHDFLSGLFITAGIRLIDVKLEFGRVFNGEDFTIMLVDEISPDTCTLWDAQTNEKLCYQVAEDNPHDLINAYQEVLKRLKYC
jgi:phosphoribosylaminoimidazole-succinocarboxamide synthase